MNKPTQMLHAPVDLRRLRRWAANRGLRYGEGSDNGYVLHVLLAGMFGPGTLQPFRLMGSERSPRGSLYGYSTNTADELARQAHMCATPDSVHVIETDTIESKTMPADFAPGTRIGFDLQARPVVRIEDPRNQRANGRRPRMIEVDVHEFETERSTAEGRRGEPDAEAAYRRWLARKIGTAGRLTRCQIRRIDTSDAWRGQRRAARGRTAVLHGEIEVNDPMAFNELIARGIGRHKAYGYGMLLLRPVRGSRHAA